MPDISEDSAIFGIITAFPGCNPDFMLGFRGGHGLGSALELQKPRKNHRPESQSGRHHETG